MNFREATDQLCQKLDHDDLAKALGVSVQSVRQARMTNDAKAHRGAPKEWPHTVIRLAEKQIIHYRRLIDDIRREAEQG